LNNEQRANAPDECDALEHPNAPAWLREWTFGNGDADGKENATKADGCRGLCFVCALAAAQGRMMLAHGSKPGNQQDAGENADAFTCRHGKPALPETRARGTRVSLRSTAPRSPRARVNG
jgi:hypothetical protein